MSVPDLGLVSSFHLQQRSTSTLISSTTIIKTCNSMGKKKTDRKLLTVTTAAAVPFINPLI